MNKTRHVLILNRRCIRHPERGGAEIYTFELAKALTGRGIDVEWFSSRPASLGEEEQIGGVKFIRKGNEFTSHVHGLLYARKKRNWLIIDEFNGIGFFTFLLPRSILLVHQLYGELWRAAFGRWGSLFWGIEKLLLRRYRRRPAMTVSSSTAGDLREIGFGDVTTIPNGLEIEPVKEIPEKEDSLTLAYLGRLKKTKNPEGAIEAFLTIRKDVRNAQLWILGEGPLDGELKRRYSSEKGIRFFGYVGEREKFERLKKAHFLVIPSIREGWGQVVIQANAMGTPAVGADVRGLRDSIRDGRTGILAKDSREMAQKMLRIWRDRRAYGEMCLASIEWASHFSWQKTGEDFISFLESRSYLWT